LQNQKQKYLDPTCLVGRPITQIEWANSDPFKLRTHLNQINKNGSTSSIHNGLTKLPHATNININNGLGLYN